MKSIAARPGESYQSIYREIGRNRQPDGRYQPWFAHTRRSWVGNVPSQGQDLETNQRRVVVAPNLAAHWLSEQINRWLRRRYPHTPSLHVYVETIYDSAYRGVIDVLNVDTLRTARVFRHRRGRDLNPKTEP